jgi:glycerol-3-phosphate dehydrogenase
MYERGGKSVTQTLFDVVVVGGGATGLGVAYDATLRGLRTLLLEKGDFASATSSASTKLLHGGVRYLEKAFKQLDYNQYRLVKEALRERDAWISLAPHIAGYLPIVTPVYATTEKWYYLTGLRIYDAVAGAGGDLRSVALDAPQTRRCLPYLAPSAAGKTLKGGVQYYDGRFHDARLAISIAKSARAAGAALFNYAHAADIEFDRNIWRIAVRDDVVGQTYVVHARALVNATGPYADGIRRMVSGSAPRVKPSKGIHLFTDKFFSPTGFLIPDTADGRVIFCLPWEGKTMIGTTDAFCETIDYRVTDDEIEYLLREVNRYLSEPLRRQDVTGTMVGYRPLILKSKAARSEALIRDHEVETVKDKKAIHVLGGKWTTFRLMAQDAVNRLFDLLDRPFVPCRTAGRRPTDFIHPDDYFRRVSRFAFLGPQTQRHLLRYGRDYEKVLDYARRSDYAPLVEGMPFLMGEYEFARRYEWVEKEEDFFKRRLSWALTDGVRKARAPIPAG